MPPAFLFDLDMTLVDSSALAVARAQQQWPHVMANLNLVRAFGGSPAPHDLPRLLAASGHPIAIVTSAPRMYAEAVLSQFGIPSDTLIAYHDTQQHKPEPEPLIAALGLLGVAPSDACHVGDDTIDMQASHRAGVLSVGACWSGNIEGDYASSAPDILLRTPDALLTLASATPFGSFRYVAEALSLQLVPSPHGGSLLPCDSAPSQKALGRYFTTEDPRHGISALSDRILMLKTDDAPAEMFARALAFAVPRLDPVPTYIVPIPPKPAETRQRFAKVLELARPLLPPGVVPCVDGLRCVKDYSGYKSLRRLADRAAAVSGAFQSNYTWNNERVLLLDDVLTTGATTSECRRVLMASQASAVDVLAFGKDQRNFAPRLCPQCGSRLKVIGGRYGNFYGCSNWRGGQGCSYKEDYDLEPL